MDCLLSLIEQMKSGNRHCRLCGQIESGDSRTGMGLPSPYLLHFDCAHKLHLIQSGTMSIPEQREAYRQAHIQQGLCIYNTNGWGEQICENKATRYNLCEAHMKVIDSEARC
jgi:hypothetical protein